jgi:hypothetical protein
VQDVHADVDPSRHSKVDGLSEDLNAKVAVVVLMLPVGPEVIVVCGGVVSPMDGAPWQFAEPESPTTPASLTKVQL